MRIDPHFGQAALGVLMLMVAASFAGPVLAGTTTLTGEWTVITDDVDIPCIGTCTVYPSVLIDEGADGSVCIAPFSTLFPDDEDVTFGNTRDCSIGAIEGFRAGTVDRSDPGNPVFRVDILVSASFPPSLLSGDGTYAGSLPIDPDFNRFGTSDSEPRCGGNGADVSFQLPVIGCSGSTRIMARRNDIVPTATPTATATATSVASPTRTPSPTSTRTATPSPTRTATRSVTPTATATSAATATPSGVSTPTTAAGGTPTATPTPAESTVVFPINGHRYGIIPGSFSWQAAREHAGSVTPPFGFSPGHLVTYSDAAEEAFVQLAFRDLLNATCIGFTDELVEGEWRWIDGTPGIWQDPDNFDSPIQSAYTNWRPALSEPNNERGQEHFAVYSTFRSPVPTWNDTTNAGACVSGYVIEFEPEAAATPTPVPACPGDCDGNGSVTIAEVQTAVQVFLEINSPKTCLAADANDDGAVSIGELQRAANSFSLGCRG